MIQGLSSPKLLELRQLVRQIVLEQGRKVVIFSQWRRMLSLAHWAISDLLAEQRPSRAGSSPGPKDRSGEPRTSSSSTTTPTSACSSPATPAASG